MEEGINNEKMIFTDYEFTAVLKIHNLMMVLVGDVFPDETSLLYSLQLNNEELTREKLQELNNATYKMNLSDMSIIIESMSLLKKRYLSGFLACRLMPNKTDETPLNLDIWKTTLEKAGIKSMNCQEVKNLWYGF